MSELRKAVVIMAGVKSHEKYMAVATFEFKEDESIYLSYRTHSVRIEKASLNKIIAALKHNEILVNENGSFITANSNAILMDKYVEVYDCVYVYNLFELNMQMIKETSHKDIILSNLRMIYNTLVTNVLGEGYYNMGCDVVTCDQYTYTDIIRKFNDLKKKNKILSASYIGLWIVIALLVFLIFLILGYYN